MGCGLLLVSKFSFSTELATLCELKAKSAAAAAKRRLGSTSVTSDMLRALKSFCVNGDTKKHE